MALDKAFLAEMDKKYGMQKAAPDHWIYSEGATTHFLTHPLPAPNTTALKVYEALHDCLHDGSVSADEVADMVTLSAGESVTWVASTYCAPLLINLFACVAPDQPLNILAAHHNDGGVLDCVEGFWASIDEAKASYGEVPEGWSDL